MLLQYKGYNLLIRLTIIILIDINSNKDCLIVIILKFIKFRKNLIFTNFMLLSYKISYIINGFIYID